MFITDSNQMIRDWARPHFIQLDKESILYDSVRIAYEKLNKRKESTMDNAILTIAIGVMSVFVSLGMGVLIWQNSKNAILVTKVIGFAEDVGGIKANVETLVKANEVLVRSHENLERCHENLERSHENLERSHENLERRQENLERSQESLVSSYENLTTRVSNIESGLAELKKESAEAHTQIRGNILKSEKRIKKRIRKLVRKLDGKSSNANSNDSN